MNRFLVLIPLSIFLLFMTFSASAQVPTIQWQKSIGGVGVNTLYSVEPTLDAGYILGGTSNANISGDKTENSRGSLDYWMVKLNDSGAIQWQKTIGGSARDELSSIQQTIDSGYILGGWSSSNVSGDKTENSKGSWDYWVVKLDNNGVIQWQKTIGGNSQDSPRSIQQTSDGGYILGGISQSPVSGDKTSNSKGYWIVKLSNNGVIQWQKAFGGDKMDMFQSIQQTLDSGYILGGWSTSNISGDKTENSKGFWDYWVIKINNRGVIQWQKTIGGIGGDQMQSVRQTADGGYILGGISASDISGDKTTNLKGEQDYWVVKLSPEIDTTTCRYKDSTALAALYRATNMQNATPQYKWNLTQPITTWYGVTLNQNGCVSCLDLDGGAVNCDTFDTNPSGIGLVGTLPDSISLLTSLERLQLQGNTGLGGVFPPNFGNLTNLKLFYVYNCRFTAPFPASFWRLPNIEDIDLNDNPLNIPFPTEFGNFRKLKGLHLCTTGLTGTIPQSLGTLDSLGNLDICDNQLTGSVPTNLIARARLQVLQIEKNKLDVLPKFSTAQFRAFFALWTPFFSVQDNRFTFDDILPNMPIINRIAATYATQDSIFKDTTYQNTERSNLTINLGIDDTVTTNIYKWYKNNVFLRTIVGVNKLVFPNLQLTDAGVYRCEVSNPNAPLLTLYSRKATVLVRSSCRTNDSLELIKFYTATNGASWTNKWNLNASMDTWQGVYFNNFGCVAQISLENNNLTGALPSDVGNVLKLNLLHLSKNKIGGKIPVSLGLMTDLTHLDLSFNQMVETIPPSLGDLRKMQYFYLGGNRLTGTIPTSLGNMTQAIEFMVNENQLSGNIPTELGNLVNVKKLLMSDNQLTGTVPTSLGTLAAVKSLQFAKNQLTGGIPTSFRNLSNLVCLVFNNNKIDFVPNLSNITSLDTGCLESQVNRLTFDDILPNLRTNSRFTYSYNPQDSIFKDTTINLTTGSTLTIDLDIDSALTTNKYVWFKNGIRFDSSNQNKLILRGVAPCDAATYTVQVTNSAAPLLTLYSRKAKIIVSGSVLPTTTNAAICNGATYRLPSGKVVSVAGNYADTIRNIRNCDSLIVNTRLTISPKVDSTRQTPVLCFGQTYTLPNGQTVSTATNYRDTVRNTSGCDILIRVVTVTTGSNPTTSNLNPSICRGQNYTLPNGQIVSPLVTTTYSETLKSQSGCDSLIRKTVVNVSVPTVLPSLNTTICRGKSYTLPSGRVVSPIITTTFGDTVRGQSRCDSLIRSINITVNQPTARPLSNSICSGQNYTLSSGKIVTASGIYQDTLPSIMGCDSLITTTTLTVTPPIETATAVVLCSGQTHRLPSNRVVSIAGVYRDTFKNGQGCNTVIVTTLAVNNIVTPRNKTIFEGQFDTLPKGRLAHTEGVYRDSFKTKNGCDSVVITTLTVKKVVIDESCFEAIKKNLPDAFSPNDDGVNDLFDPEKYFILSGCPSSLQAEQLQIVSRWGEVIYKAKPYEAWNGTSNGYKKPVATGAYYYVLVFNTDGKEKIIRGVINCFSR